MASSSMAPRTPLLRRVLHTLIVHDTRIHRQRKLTFCVCQYMSRYQALQQQRIPAANVLGSTHHPLPARLNPSSLLPLVLQITFPLPLSLQPALLLALSFERNQGLHHLRPVCCQNMGQQGT